MPSHDLGELSVLFLEQHASMRSLMRTVLRELGITRIKEAADPAQAFDLFQKEDFDLILTDWTPTFDGLAFLGNIRNHEKSRNPYAPVIVVTAHAEIEQVHMARDAGMTEFLAKPISATRLHGRIRSALDGRRPFVKSRTFFGPDRRRRRMEFDGIDRRKNGSSETAVGAAGASRTGPRAA